MVTENSDNANDANYSYYHRDDVNGVSEYSPQTRKELEHTDFIGNTTNTMQLNELIEGKNKDIKSLKKQNEEYYKGLKIMDDSLCSVKTQLNESKNRNIELEQLNEQLDKDKEVLLNRYKRYKKQSIDLLEENKQLEKDYEKATQESEKYCKDYDELKQKFDKDKENYEQRIKNLEQHNNNLEQYISKQKKIYEQALQQHQEQSNNIIGNFRQKLNEKGDDLRELEEANSKLREEASKYQSALGVATNTRLDDDDQNHSVKLKEDILNLQDMLENYVTNLKPNMDVNIEKIRLLAQEYGYFGEITTRDKPFIKTILQRKVLDTVNMFNEDLDLSKCKGKDFTLEPDIELKAQELLELIKRFSTTRVGTDETVKVAAIKIRQQVYGILGNRGFENIIRSDGIYMHDLINYVSVELNKMMEQYRRIKDIDRKKQVEDMAPKLIQNISKLFQFRLRVQEPIAEDRFFENDIKIDPIAMTGIWEEDEIDQLRVGICYFPLIGRDLESPNRKIYTPAKVFPLYISSEGENEESDKDDESSGISAIISNKVTEVTKILGIQ